MSQSEKSSQIKLLLKQSQKSYRVIIDIIVKLNQANVDLTYVREASKAIQAYQSDHIRFLPKISDVLAGDDTDDRMLTRTIL